MKSFDKWFNQQGKEPTLGDIVTDICGRIGINRADVDVSDLENGIEGFEISDPNAPPCTCHHYTYTFVYSGDEEIVTCEHHQSQQHPKVGG